ncbi:Uncharacterised protein [Aeromonas hydrophila]|nr:Uncharacterised protein [Aeromonas hydrophila]
MQQRLLRAPREAGLQAHLPPLGELDGVAEQVEDDLAQAQRVDEHSRQGGQLDPVAKPLLLGHPLAGAGHRVEQRRQLARLGGQGQLARFDAGDVQHIADEIEQAVGGFGGDAQLLAGVAGEGGILARQLQHAENGVHGGADLVAHGGQKVALGPAGAVGLLLGAAQRLLHGLAFGDVDPAVDHPADGAAVVKVGHHPVVDELARTALAEDAIRQYGAAASQHLLKILFQGGDGLGAEQPLEPLGKRGAEHPLDGGVEGGQVLAVAEDHLAPLVAHHYGVGQALAERLDEAHVLLQLAAGGLLRAGQPVEHAVAVKQQQGDGAQPRQQQVEIGGVALHEGGGRQFAVAPLVTHHRQLVGGDGEDGLVDDVHQHPVGGEACKAHPDGLVVGGAGDADLLESPPFHRMLGKIERHDGGIEAPLVDRLHRLVGALQKAHLAVAKSSGDGVVDGAAHLFAGELCQIAV